jgi:hypothetical protein
VFEFGQWVAAMDGGGAPDRDKINGICGLNYLAGGNVSACMSPERQEITHA